jgi:hypothetical protein
VEIRCLGGEEGKRVVFERRERGVKRGKESEIRNRGGEEAWSATSWK